jgi:hypothetical protein
MSYIFNEYSKPTPDTQEPSFSSIVAKACEHGYTVRPVSTVGQHKFNSSEQIGTPSRRRSQWRGRRSKADHPVASRPFPLVLTSIRVQISADSVAGTFTA